MRLRWLSVCLSLAISVLVFAAAAWAENEPDDMLEKAIASYGRALESGDRDARLADFRRAQRIFGALVDGGAENAALQTNLGNAALQAEDLGHAILAYRRALLLDPSHSRARQNLIHARSLLADWVPRPAEGGVLDTFFFWHEATSRAARSRIAAACFALACLGFSVATLMRSALPRFVAIPAACAWLALMVSLAFDPARAARDEGVVVASEATARSADSINAPGRFAEPLPAGSEVKILEDRGGWIHIELHNGRNAWLVASNVKRVAQNNAENLSLRR